MLPVMLVILLGYLGALGLIAWNIWKWPPSRVEASYRKAVAKYDPRFLIHFSAPVESEYQILMWLPIFERVGMKYLVVVRERNMFDIVAEATKVPVVLCPTLPSVEAVLDGPTSAVFYVNNSMKNSQSVRFGDKVHVQILHGESDKPASYNPVTAMFDEIYVAGQGRDRPLRPARRGHPCGEVPDRRASPGGEGVPGHWPGDGRGAPAGAVRADLARLRQRRRAHVPAVGSHRDEVPAGSRRAGDLPAAPVLVQATRRPSA